MQNIGKVLYLLEPVKEANANTTEYTYIYTYIYIYLEIRIIIHIYLYNTCTHASHRVTLTEVLTWHTRSKQKPRTKLLLLHWSRVFSSGGEYYSGEKLF